MKSEQNEFHNLDEYFLYNEENVFSHINKYISHSLQNKDKANDNSTTSVRKKSKTLNLKKITVDCVNFITYDPNAKCIKNTFKIMYNGPNDNRVMYEMPQMNFVVGKKTRSKFRQKNPYLYLL